MFPLPTLVLVQFPQEFYDSFTRNNHNFADTYKMVKFMLKLLIVFFFIKRKKHTETNFKLFCYLSSFSRPCSLFPITELRVLNSRLIHLFFFLPKIGLQCFIDLDLEIDI